MAIGRVAITAAALLISHAACRNAPGANEEPGAWYRASLSFDKLGELPFFLHLPAVGKHGKAYVLNGEENADFDAEWNGNEVSIKGPWNYPSAITATRYDTGELRGKWTRYTPLWGAVVREFSADLIDRPDPMLRFGPGAKPKASAAGIWRFHFDTHAEGKGVFEQNSDGVVRGYVKPGELGDIRFLAGNMRGLKLSLSQFNGNAANLVVAELSPDGTSMTGIVSLENVWNERFTAKKGGDFDVVAKVHIKDGTKSVKLRGLDRYRGKPTLAFIFATWCSSCNDASPYLAQLYATYHPRGLEMLGVAYDLTTDEKANLAELDIFREKYKIPWELEQVPCTPETWAASMPPELDGWEGLPILILVRPDGSVQSVFGGWFGPATGADGEKRRKTVEQAVDQLVAGTRAKHG